jgi:plastocyanin
VVLLLALPAALAADCSLAPGEPRPVASPADGTGPAQSASGAHTLPSTDDRRATEAVQANEVVIDSFAYKPARLVVKVGAKVSWVNRDDLPHTATTTAKPRAFDSGTLDTDGRFTHVFTVPGTYEYFCAVHPHMTGRIIVE